MSVKADGRIGVLLSFDLNSLGDFVIGHFIGLVDGDIAFFSSCSIFSMEVCV